MKHSLPGAIRRFLRALIKQVNHPLRRAGRRGPDSRPLPGAPEAPPASKRATDAEPAVEGSGIEPETPPVDLGSTEQTAEDAPQTGSTSGEAPDSSGNFKIRFDAVRGRIGNQGQDGELEAMLDQAITLLESLSQQPAIRDYSANQRRLDEIEQRLNQSGNVF
jgi:hypothetical protein